MRAAIFDLDGVIRHWDIDGDTSEQHGFPPGSLNKAAYEPALLRRVVTGEITHEEWCAVIAETLTAAFGRDAGTLVAAWNAPCGRVDHEVVEIVRGVRRVVPVALLSNATSKLRGDLRRLEIIDEFDVIFNSSELGVAKPDPRVFELACAALGVEPADCFFVDDTPGHVSAAKAAGLNAHLHTSAAGLRAQLAGVGAVFGTAT